MKKQEKTICGFLLQENKYNFLRRHYPHQVKGSKVIPSSQPVNTSSPVFSVVMEQKSTGCSAISEIVQIKTGDTLPDASGKKSMHDDFLRRHYPHQVKGSKLDDFLSACRYKLPCFYL